MNSNNKDLFNSDEWNEFYNYCNNGIFKQIDFFRYEDVHTNYLKSLFEKDNVFQLGSMPLELLIELLKNNDDDKTKHKLKDIDFKNCVITEFDTKKQVYIDSGRLDLLIDFSIYNKINYSEKKYSIILENKVLSSERENQTKDYQDYYEKNNDGSIEYIYVFLSLEKNVRLSSDGSKYGDYIKITYQELIDNVLEECSKKEDKNIVPINIDEYLKGFTYLCEFGYMPITSTLRKLSVAIYNNYSEELINILNEKKGEYNEFYSNNIKQFKILFTVLEKEVTTKKDLKDKINRIVFGKVGKFRKKDNDKYTYYGCREQTKMVRDILKDLIDNGYLKTIKDLEELKFSDNSPWKPAITEEQYKAVGNKQSNYSKDNDLIVESKTLYYSYPVLNEELKGFVECVIKKYPNYKKLIEVC